MTAPDPWRIEPFAVVDGGLSTALESLGERVGGELWTAQLVMDRPERIVAAHRSFVEAGADVVISASYQASEEGFVRAGAEPAAARRLLASTTDLARRSGAAVVAASVGPFGAVLGDGSEYHGRYAAPWEEVRAFHRRRIAVLADTGPDLVAVETVPTRAEAEIIVEELAARTELPAWVSFSCAGPASSCGGDAIGAAAGAVAGCPNVIAVGINCTAPQHVAALLRAIAADVDLPLVAYPNHGAAWDAAEECWIGAAAGDAGASAAEWHRTGARFIGGCCGVGPDGVRSVAAARRALTSRA